jgi:hypothetical protein
MYSFLRKCAPSSWPSYSDFKKSQKIVASHLSTGVIGETDKGYQSVAEAGDGLNTYFEFYNCEGRIQSLDIRTPCEVCWDSLPKQKAAS